MHLNSQLIFKRYVLPTITDGVSVLEIGPDNLPSTYREMAGAGIATWDTVDLFARDGLTFLATGENSFPIVDDRYDIVLSGQVLEHVRKPWIWIKEVVRVCKPGGLVITISPVSWPYHEAPIDCWRVYPAGMAALLDDCNVDILVNEYDCLEIGSDGDFVLPGRSEAAQWRKQRLMGNLLNRFGVPKERAFDLVCIAKKR